jgi:hypothetical protein
MGCLENIVTLGACQDAEASLSGFTLMQAPGISLTGLDEIANENYVQGVKMAMEKKQLTITQVKNDFIGALTGNKIATKLAYLTYDTSEFKGATLDNFNGERGLTVYKVNKYRGRLRKTRITQIQLFPANSADNIAVKIYDNGLVSTYPVNLVANQINTINVLHEIQGNFARVLVDNSIFQPKSASLTCMLGCNGTTPNECGYTKGWDGGKEVKSEGFGVNVKFSCVCDYEQILCDLAKGFVGEIIWLKWQINIFEEQLRSNRFSHMVVYNQESLKDQIQTLENKYAEKWNALMGGLFDILKSYHDDCLDCRGIRWVTNG